MLLRHAWVISMAVATCAACGGGSSSSSSSSSGGSGGTTGSAPTSTALPDPSGLRQIDPRYAHSGTQLAFAQEVDGGDYTVALMNADGSNVRQLPIGADYLSGFAWSADDSELYESGSTITVITLDGGATRDLFKGGLTGFASEDPDLSPDGRKLVFAVNGSPMELVDLTQSPPSAQQLAFTGRSPRFSPDGTKILFADGNNIRIIDVATLQATEVVSSNDFFASCDWLSDGRHVVAKTDNGVEIITVGSSPLERRTILTSDVGVLSIDAAPDDKHVAYTLNCDAPIYVLSGF